MAEMREFETGATRNVDTSKLDYEGFLSPLVLERYAAYMHKHRRQADGELRASDNWQKGIPREAYMKSGLRHCLDWWKEHRKLATADGLEEALCALIFNAMGYLHEVLVKRGDSMQPPTTPTTCQDWPPVPVLQSMAEALENYRQARAGGTIQLDPNEQRINTGSVIGGGDGAGVEGSLISGSCSYCGNSELRWVSRHTEMGGTVEPHCRQCGRGR
jgi:hypothetical protein